jgi:hypothetical protein
MKIEKGWRLYIKDKVIISKSRFCPPHTFPHKLPFAKPITREYCHYHKARWRMLHHILFCKFLKCKNYKFMIKKYKKNKDY